jgi:hypothetical protein
MFLVQALVAGVRVQMLASKYVCAIVCYKYFDCGFSQIDA